MNFLQEFSRIDISDDVRSHSMYRKYHRKYLFELLIKVNNFPHKKSKKSRLFKLLVTICKLLVKHKNNEKYIIKIQKWFRNYKYKKIEIKRGIALFNRNLCVNECDILTTIPVKEIPNSDFISIIQNNIVYGFDTNTLGLLISKYGLKNPYTREPLNINLQFDCITLLPLHTKFGTIDFEMPNIMKTRHNSRSYSFNSGMNYETIISRRITNIFIQIQQDHGFILNIEWFTELTLYNTIDLYENIRRKIRSLTPRMRRKILSNNINCLFPRTGKYYRENNIDKHIILLQIIDILRRINSISSTTPNKCIGIILFIQSLAIVNNNCKQIFAYLI